MNLDKQSLFNQKHAFLSFVLSLYVFLPNLLLFININHLIYILLFVFILGLTGMYSRFLFSVLSIAVLVLTVVFSHIYVHWGFNGISSRLQADMLSPMYESLEYLQTYFDWRDVLLLVYMFFGFLNA